MGYLLLTSTGLSNKNVCYKFKEIVKLNRFKKAVIITTAAEGKENNKYSQLASEQLGSLGLSVEFYDMELEGSKNLSLFDVIYVCGGNTFKLIKFARETNLFDNLHSLLRRNGLYIGVSAGSLIVGPSIQIASEISPDPNDVGITNFTGLGIVNCVIFPHYSGRFETEIQDYEKRHNIHVERLTNDQAILYTEEVKSLI